MAVSWLGSAALALFIFVFMGGIGWIWISVFFGTAAGIAGAIGIGLLSAYLVNRAVRRVMFEGALWLHGPDADTKREIRREYRRGGFWR